MLHYLNILQLKQNTQLLACLDVDCIFIAVGNFSFFGPMLSLMEEIH